MNDEEKRLPQTLATISKLEQEHHLLGVSFAVKQGRGVATPKVLTGESADYVVGVINTAVKDIEELDFIPTYSAASDKAATGRPDSKSNRQKK